MSKKRGIDVMDDSLVMLLRSCSRDPQNTKTLRDLLHEDNMKHIFNLITAGHVDKDEEEIVLRGKHYLDNLLTRICAFYNTYLSQSVIRLPKVDNIVKDPAKYFDDTQLYMLLLLGCATQCNERFLFFEKIASLETVHFFRAIAQLRRLRDFIREYKSAQRSSRFLRHFRALNFGAKPSSVVIGDGSQQSPETDEPQSRVVFDCKEDCPFSPIYQIKIQKDLAMQLDTQEKIQNLEMQIKCQNELIDTLKEEYEAKLRKQSKFIATFAQSDEDEGNEDANDPWSLMSGKSKTEEDLLYKIETYKNLLNLVAEEWSKEEIKYNQLKDEIKRIKRFVNPENQTSNQQTTSHAAVVKRLSMQHVASLQIPPPPGERSPQLSTRASRQLEYLDLTSLRVPKLIRMFENKNTGRRSKILQLKAELLASNSLTPAPVEEPGNVAQDVQEIETNRTD